MRGDRSRGQISSSKNGSDRTTRHPWWRRGRSRACWRCFTGVLSRPRRIGWTSWWRSQERQVIERHPGYAYEFLSSIPYLRPALDIPYCHHEKWDGTGYPRGLKGEQIPLVARIFAVADVWDALRSDRPYRKGWSDEQALQYIREQSGTHFDPKVAGLFLKTEPLRG